MAVDVEGAFCYSIPMEPAKAPGGRKPLRIGRRVGLTDRVHERLTELILDQKLGPGSYLNIDKLCRELEVSSSPLREALARLSAQRLVHFEPFIGYTVAPIPDREYYRSLMDLRVLLEGYAARLGAGNCTPSTISAMERALRAMERVSVGAQYREYRAFNAADANFHRALVDSAGNTPLSQAYADLHVHLHVARLYVLLGGFDAKSAVLHHAKILEAFRKRDADSAEAAVRDHLLNVQVMQSWSTPAKS